MPINEKRHSRGALKPNIFFSLQIIIVCIIAYIVIQFNFGTGVTYIIIVTSIIFIILFFMRRNEIINREVIEREIIDKKIIHHDD